MKKPMVELTGSVVDEALFVSPDDVRGVAAIGAGCAIAIADIGWRCFPLEPTEVLDRLGIGYYHNGADHKPGDSNDE